MFEMIKGPGSDDSGAHFEFRDKAIKATLALNHHDNIALFYNEPLGVVPEWASIDVEQGEIHIGGADIEARAIKLDQIDRRIYGRIRAEEQVLLIQMKNVDGKSLPVAIFSVPLMISMQD